MLKILEKLLGKSKTKVEKKHFFNSQIPDEGPFVVARFDPMFGSIQIWEGEATLHDGIWTIHYDENGMRVRTKLSENQTVPIKSTMMIDPRMAKKYLTAIARAAEVFFLNLGL